MGLQRPIAGAVARVLGSRGGAVFPTLNRIFFTKATNSEARAWVEGDAWVEAGVWAWYALPVETHAAVGTGFWFADATTPIPNTMVDALADAGTNIGAGLVFAGADRGVAVYSTAPDAPTYIRLARYFKFTPV